MLWSWEDPASDFRPIPTSVRPNPTRCLSAPPPPPVRCLREAKLHQIFAPPPPSLACFPESPRLPHWDCLSSWPTGTCPKLAIVVITVIPIRAKSPCVSAAPRRGRGGPGEAAPAGDEVPDARGGALAAGGGAGGLARGLAARRRARARASGPAVAAHAGEGGGGAKARGEHQQGRCRQTHATSGRRSRRRVGRSHERVHCYRPPFQHPIAANGKST